jgi:hypothetical protein
MPKIQKRLCLPSAHIQRRKGTSSRRSLDAGSRLAVQNCGVAACGSILCLRLHHRYQGFDLLWLVYHLDGMLSRRIQNDNRFVRSCVALSRSYRSPELTLVPSFG